MADDKDSGSGIFRKSAMSNISSADELDTYIKVTNPSVWLVLIAAAMVVGGLLIWSATSVIPTTIDLTGIAKEGKATCWVDEETKDKIKDGGVHIRMLDESVTEVEIGDMPMSAAEVKHKLGSDYLADSVSLQDWNYELCFSSKSEVASSSENRLVPVAITVSETNPIDLVLGGK